jgi:hypothetical protein
MILVTQVPKIDFASKLPNNKNKKKKNTKFSHSHKEILKSNLPKYPQLDEATHKEMNPVTAAALTTTLVWSSILDAMQVQRYKLKIRARITKALLV